MRPTPLLSLSALTILLTGCDANTETAKKPEPAAVAPAPPPPARDLVKGYTLPGNAAIGTGTKRGAHALSWTIKPGQGDALPGTPTIAVFRVRGWTTDGKQYFGDEDNWDELLLSTGEATTFRGWSDAIAGQRVGEIRKVWIEGDESSSWPVQDTQQNHLVMDLELMSIEPASIESDSIPGMPIGDATLKGSSTGLRWFELAPGTGAPLKAGDTATIRCAAWLGDGTPWQDATEMPVTITIDESMMPALAEGLMGMSPGGMRKLIIPPQLGVGFDPTSNTPPGAVLVMDVECVPAGDTTANATN